MPESKQVKPFVILIINYTQLDVYGVVACEVKKIK